MNAIIKQIEEALAHGCPIDVKTGPLATQVLKEIQKQMQTLEKDSSQKKTS